MYILLLMLQDSPQEQLSVNGQVATSPVPLPAVSAESSSASAVPSINHLNAYVRCRTDIPASASPSNEHFNANIRCRITCRTGPAGINRISVH
jgi:hypothetical protein